MATRSVRFGIGDPAGARSAEWVIRWQTRTSDVYLASRSLGNTFRISLHESGQCLVHGPDPEKWTGPEAPRDRMDEWYINPEGEFQHPVGVIVPVSELRVGAWMQHKDKGTL